MAKGFVSEMDKLSPGEKRLLQAARSLATGTAGVGLSPTSSTFLQRYGGGGEPVDPMDPKFSGTQTALLLARALSKLQALESVASAEIREKEKARVEASKASKPKARGKDEVRTRSRERLQTEKALGVKRGSGR